MGEEVSGVEIFNIVLRSIDYTYTLSDLITSCHNGYDFVLRRLNNMSNEKQEFLNYCNSMFIWLLVHMLGLPDGNMKQSQ